MEAFAALSVASNIIDLVGKAVKGVATVIEVYKSVDGISSNNEIINREADSLKDIVANLQDCQSQAPYNTADQEMREISTTLISKCAELQSVLNRCRSSQKRGLWSAGNASFKMWRRKTKIEQLQNEMVSSQDQLFRWIAASARKLISTGVYKTLKRLEDISQTNCEIQTTVDKVDARLDAWFNVASGSMANTSGNGAYACLEEIRQVVTDRVILQLLDFPTLKSRFEDVLTEEEGTFEWIFTQPDVVLEKEPELATTFPDWLESGDGIFHICGKPGSGKSTLMKYICRNPTTAELLANWSGNDELLTAKFFFWRVGVIQEQKNMRGLIRGLLHQILCKVPKLSNHIFSRETREKLVDGLQKHSGAELESDEIMAAFSRLVEISTELVEKLCQWTTNSNGHVKICVSSRIEEPFMGMLDKSKRFTLHNLTEGDIKIFIEQSLESHSRFQKRQQKNPQECQELLDNVRQSADGVFLWVALVLKDIEHGLDDDVPIQRLRKIVSEKPRDLDALLEQIMGTINTSSRHGVEVLLSAVLRATGTLLSREDRGLEYVYFDEGCTEDLNISALSSLFVLRAADTGLSMREDLNMDEFDLKKEEWFQDGMADDEIIKAASNTVRTRCKGLVDIIDVRGGKFVKFMHRSIPEFLHTYFSRASPFKLHHDHQSTVVMSWAFLVDLKWNETKYQRLSLPSVSRLVTEDISHSTNLFRIDALVCRLRQMKLGDEWEDLFRILFDIGQALPIARNHWGFVDRCAATGLHEFIDWLFRKTDMLADDFSRALVIFYALQQADPANPFLVAILESAFAHGVDARMAIPPGMFGYLDGQLLWHCALILLKIGKDEDDYKLDAPKGGYSGAMAQAWSQSSVLDWKPHNESRLLELLNDDAEDSMHGVQEPPKTEQDSSEIGHDHSKDLPASKEALASLEYPEPEASANENDGVTRPNQSSRGWAMHMPIRLHIQVVIISMLGIIITYFIQL
ncbi:hypothetical protein E0Z10_g860 [Xylaria hypoxylon]|uniref:Nephrocystin 3-like N-terminal domain-containing protein n=1 Tax=Xylaria hypoxylon TaxID=37992 RepID=A0A4Z0Z7Y9_9PEZI|nr:hypothetical protein E0Z10_g860 [Xylaria hypoxylon]